MADADRAVLAPGRSDPKTPWLKSSALALAIHLAVAGGFLLTFSAKPMEVSAPPAAMKVMLMASAPPTPATSVPIAEQPKEATPTPPVKQDVKPEPPRPDHVEKPVATPDKPLPKQQKAPDFKLPDVATTTPAKIAVSKTAQQAPPPPSKQAVIEQSVAPATAQAAPSKQVTAPTEGATPVRNPPEITWEGSVLALLEKNKRYPSIARFKKQEDVIYVKFSLDRKGQLLSANIIRSQGFDPLDAEVMSLLKRVEPFPTPPTDMVGNSIDLVVPIEFYLSRK